MNTNPATMIMKPELYFACPHCGAGDQHSVTHFLPVRQDVAFGPWQCKTCGWAVTGRWHHATQTVDVLSLEQRARPAKGFMLLRIAASKAERPIFFVVEHQISTRDGFEGLEEWTDRQRHWVGEHTCPTNIVPVTAIIEGQDQDPHGVLEFVAFAPEPDGWDADACDWSVLFPQVGGAEIEGVAVIGFPGQPAQQLAVNASIKGEAA